MQSWAAAPSESSGSGGTTSCLLPSPQSWGAGRGAASEDKPVKKGTVSEGEPGQQHTAGESGFRTSYVEGRA